MVRDEELYHWGIKGMKWGVRRFQNPDGSLTPAGKKRYSAEDGEREEKPNYAPKAPKKSASDYTDDELRAQINRMQMESSTGILPGRRTCGRTTPTRN